MDQISTPSLSRKTSRNYGIDLLRIVSMYLVVILHVLKQGGILDAAKYGSVQYHLAWLLETAAFCAVNCYGLVSGYVGLTSRFRLTNLLQLLLTVLFYSVGITALFAVFVPGSTDLKAWIRALLPFVFNMYWYFSAYFCLFFFTPFLNHLMLTLHQRQASLLVLALVFLFSLLPTCFDRDIFMTENGYSFLWLAVLYLIGGYLRKYDCMKSISGKQLFLGYIACVLVTWVSKAVIAFATARLLGYITLERILLNYTSPTILGCAVFLLLLFARFRPSDGCTKWISFFSPLAFSVYLNHTHPLVWNHLLHNRFAGFAHYTPVTMAGAVLGTAITIWLVCSLIDALRLWLFRLLRINAMCNTLDQHLRVLFLRLFPLTDIH